MKRKIFGILLIVCFVAPVATTYVMLQFQKKQVKKEIKWKMIAGIDKEELVLLKFTEKEIQTQLKWKHAKEFEYKSEMYDVVETNTLSDTTYYWVWWDHQETKLSKQLNKLVSFALGNNPKQQENQKKLQNFFKSLYFSTPERKEYVVFQEVKNKHYFGQNFYQSLSASPSVPPPEKS